MKSLFFGLLALALASSIALAAGDADKGAGHQEHEGHSESEGGGHDHEEGEEEAGNVGPEKGIIEANEKAGFKLSAEAHKNFELKTQKLSGDGPWAIPSAAVVHAGEEVNLFRMRAGFFKRIDFQNIRKSNKDIVVDSDDMREGDEIVVAGLGFLRIAELAAFGGVAHGHSH